MDAATLGRAFEPFFSTKALGRGLGLSALHGVVKSLGGAVLVTTAPGRGATFRVLLPAAAPAETTPVPPRAAIATSRVARRVLVVDDEASVRNALVRMLRRLGHAPLGAPDGAAAIALVEGGEAPFDCAIVDWTMPGMDGVAVVRALGRVAPAVATILMSGYELDVAEGEPTGAIADAFLSKPYSIPLLDAAIEQALAARAAGGARAG
jgi:CheY-like chemotaxis protein